MLSTRGSVPRTDAELASANRARGLFGSLEHLFLAMGLTQVNTTPMPRKMKYLANKQFQLRTPKLGTSSIFLALLLGLSIPAVAFVTSAGASPALNSVDVTIQTTKALPYQYTLTAYNTSGFQVANFYGNYPEAAFGLPSGTYLITASAYYQQSYVCNLCPLEKGAVNGSSSSIAIRYVPPYSEYGYAVEKLTGPAQITITTSNSSQSSLVKLPIHVQFYNGTSAAGAYVSAYVVGGNYAYPQNWVSYGQTGSDGNFTLFMPNAPIEVSTYMSYPINLPKSISTVPVVIGGQKFNVTVYWQPSSVNLSGQALILPPEKGAEITLQVQQSYPYPVYYAGQGTAGSGGVTTVTTTVSTTTATPQQGVSPQTNRIAPFSPSSAQVSSPGQQTTEVAPGFSAIEAVIIALGAAAIVGVGAMLVLVRRKSTVQPARP